MNAAQQVVLTFPDLFNNTWLNSIYNEVAMIEDEHQIAIKAAVREQLDYRLLLKCIEGYNSWKTMSKKNPMLEKKPGYFLKILNFEARFLKLQKIVKSTRVGALI